jgi:predicted HTH transcriptional regulator
MGAEIEGEYRKDVYELPISAIREMIANAVLHRSYLDKSCVQVCLYDDRLEVSSPGMLYGGLDLKTAKLGKSTCRNEAIAEAFHYMHIVEAWGTGIPRIINRCKEYGLPEPLFEEFGDGFKVTMFRKVSNASEKVSNASEKVSNAPEKVSNAFEKYISLFEEAQVTDTFINNIEQVFRKCGIGIPFGQTNVMEWLDCSKSKATNIMNAMKAAKVIKKVTGVGPGKYEFVEI